MSKIIKKRSTKAGLEPGSLIHIGEQRVEETSISIITYSESYFEERVAASVDECFDIKEQPYVTWINIEGIHQVEVLERLGECFGLHPLVLEDILNTDQRPKMEDFGDYVYIVLKMLFSDADNEGITAEQVSLILGANFVISFQEGIVGDLFNSIRERLRNEKAKIRRMGADYLTYTLVDSIVDNYFAILEGLGEHIETIEDELIAHPEPKTLNEIHYLKREMIFLRRSVWPLREVINGLERGESPLIKDSTHIYLKDVYDHTIQVIDTIETFRDMLAGMLDIYLSSISNKMNEVMKVLTIIATIFIPLTFIVGIYGMNFKYMPELDVWWTYPMVWAVMIAIALVMVMYFRRRKWM
jgi:magnesium transporter